MDVDIENYYNIVEIKYKVFWNLDGSKYWGYFDNLDVFDQEVELF